MLLIFLIWQSGLMPCVETTGNIFSRLLSTIVFYVCFDYYIKSYFNIQVFIFIDNGSYWTT